MAGPTAASEVLAAPELPPPVVAASAAPSSPPGQGDDEEVDWGAIDRVITRQEITDAVRNHTYAFVCFQGKVWVDFSRDPRVRPTLALLGAPQVDVLPLRRKDPADFEVDVPWWDPRISEGMIRRRQVVLSRNEAAMRNATFVNRRNMHKSGRPGFAEMHEYYWGPMQEFRSANVDLLASQELELQDLGLEVPGRQSPVPSVEIGAAARAKGKAPVEDDATSGGVGPSDTAGPSGTVGQAVTAGPTRAVGQAAPAGPARAVGPRVTGQPRAAVQSSRRRVRQRGAGPAAAAYDRTLPATTLDELLEMALIACTLWREELRINSGVRAARSWFPAHIHRLLDVNSPDLFPFQAQAAPSGEESTDGSASTEDNSQG